MKNEILLSDELLQFLEENVVLDDDGVIIRMERTSPELNLLLKEGFREYDFIHLIWMEIIDIFFLRSEKKEKNYIPIDLPDFFICLISLYFPSLLKKPLFTLQDLLNSEYDTISEFLKNSFIDYIPSDEKFLSELEYIYENEFACDVINGNFKFKTTGNIEFACKTIVNPKRNIIRFERNPPLKNEDRIVIDNNKRILWLENFYQVKLNPWEIAIYRLFLNHTDGIILDDIKINDELKEKLKGYYLKYDSNKKAVNFDVFFSCHNSMFITKMRKKIDSINSKIEKSNFPNDDYHIKPEHEKQAGSRYFIKSLMNLNGNYAV